MYRSKWKQPTWSNKKNLTQAEKFYKLLDEWKNGNIQVNMEPQLAL